MGNCGVGIKQYALTLQREIGVPADRPCNVLVLRPGKTENINFSSV